MKGCCQMERNMIGNDQFTLEIQIKFIVFVVSYFVQVVLVKQQTKELVIEKILVPNSKVMRQVMIGNNMKRWIELEKKIKIKETKMTKI